MSDEGAAAPRNAAPLPWDGQAERADLILMGGIVFSGLYLLALMPLTPSMVYDHPVILELLKGSMTAMITMGAKARIGEASLLVAVLAAIPGLMWFDWLYWWAGKRWGKRAIDVFLGNHPKAVQRTAPAREVHRALRLRSLIVIVYFQPLPERARVRRRRLDRDAIAHVPDPRPDQQAALDRVLRRARLRDRPGRSTSRRRCLATRCSSRSA